MIILRLILTPFAFIYAIAIFIRNLLFDIGLLKAKKVDASVISIGNITVGGTGKTPIVEFLIKYLQEKKLRVAIVSRGYKRKSKGLVIVSNGITINEDPMLCGDEPVQISKKFPGAIVIVSEDKYSAAKLATDKFNANIILIDDGFQHRKIYRDFDVVIMDNSLSNFDYFLLPLGYGREPIRSLKRAHFILITNKKNGDKAIKNYYNKPFALFTYSTDRFKSIFEENISNIGELYNKSCYAFCGIGKPDSFYNSLTQNGIKVKKFKKFPDHHYYSDAEIDKIISEYRALECNMIITTEKDAVKLTKYAKMFKDIPVYYIEVVVKFIQNEDKFLNEIDKLIK